MSRCSVEGSKISWTTTSSPCSRGAGAVKRGGLHGRFGTRLQWRSRAKRLCCGSFGTSRPALRDADFTIRQSTRRGCPIDGGATRGISTQLQGWSGGAGGLTGRRQLPPRCWGTHAFCLGAGFWGGRLSSSYFLRRLRLSLLLYRLHALTTEFSEYYSEIGDSRPHATAAGDSAMPGPRRGHWGDRGIPLFAPRFCLLGTFCFICFAVCKT